MIEWNEQNLKDLARKMGLRRVRGQGKAPIHLSLYRAPFGPEPLLAKIMRLDADQWAALGYDETDRVSLVQYLGSLGCRADGAWLAAAMFQHPLPLELAKLLIDAGAFDKDALSRAAYWQHPLTLEMARFLIDVGCDPVAQNSGGWDTLVWLVHGGHPVAPQVTELFLSAGCRTSLDGCGWLLDKHRLRFDQILAKHAQWKENLSRMSTENLLTGTFYGPDWGR